MGDSRKIMQVRSARQVPVRVMLLDDEMFEDSVDKRAVGFILFDKVCEHLNLLEKDYFGLCYRDPTGLKYWVNNEKKIAKQVKGGNWDFTFEVKFYSPEPSQLAEDITRYMLCLQIRRDIVNERLPCSFLTYTLLGSYTSQSEIGDYNVEECGSGCKYLKDLKFAPHQDKELLQKIAELHRQHKGQTPEEAELHFLENAVRLSMYGVELHPARDAEGSEISLGVCASGLIVYKDNVQMNRFVWPKVLKISYRRNKYYIKIRPGEFEEFASLIGFKLLNVKMAKRLWKISVEHHSFFRFRESDQPKQTGLMPRFGSRFRYSGRTQFQTRQLAAIENRDSPAFDRVMSKRGTFAGRTKNMRKRDEDRQHRRDELRKQPVQPFSPDSKPPPVADRPREDRKPSPPEPKHPPPELKHAPPVAPKPTKPKPSPREPSSENASLNRSFDSFEDVPDRRSKMERMHAVPTPLAAIMQKSMEKEHEDDRNRYHDDDEHDNRYRHQVGKSEPIRGRRFRSRSENHHNQRSQRNTLSHDKARNRDQYLFSYPSSSIDSILSTDFDEYDGEKGLDDSRTYSVDALHTDQGYKSTMHDLSYRHSSEDVSSSSDQSKQSKSSDGIYAEIDKVKKEIHSRNVAKGQMPGSLEKEIKPVYGLKRILFSRGKGKQSLQSQETHLQTNLPTSKHLSKETPKYAKINKNPKDQHHSSIDNTDNSEYSTGNDLVDLLESNNSSLREELKMYILSPEKLNSMSETTQENLKDSVEKQTDIKSSTGPGLKNKENSAESACKIRNRFSSKCSENQASNESVHGPDASSSKNKKGMEVKTKIPNRECRRNSMEQMDLLYVEISKVPDKVSVKSDSVTSKGNMGESFETSIDEGEPTSSQVSVANNTLHAPENNLRGERDKGQRTEFVSGTDLKVVSSDPNYIKNDCLGESADKSSTDPTVDGSEDLQVKHQTTTTLTTDLNSGGKFKSRIYENLPVSDKCKLVEDNKIGSYDSSQNLINEVDRQFDLNVQKKLEVIEGDINQLDNISLDSACNLSLDGERSELSLHVEQPSVEVIGSGSSSSLYQIVFDGSSLGSPDDSKDVSYSNPFVSLGIGDTSRNDQLTVDDNDLERFSTVSSESSEIDVSHPAANSSLSESSEKQTGKHFTKDTESHEKKSSTPPVDTSKTFIGSSNGALSQNKNMIKEGPFHNERAQDTHLSKSKEELPVSDKIQHTATFQQQATQDAIPATDAMQHDRKPIPIHKISAEIIDSISDKKPREKKMLVKEKAFQIEDYEDEPFKRRIPYLKPPRDTAHSKLDQSIDEAGKDFFTSPNVVDDLHETFAKLKSSSSEKEGRKIQSADSETILSDTSKKINKSQHDDYDSRSICLKSDVDDKKASTKSSEDSPNKSKKRNLSESSKQVSNTNGTRITSLGMGSSEGIKCDHPDGRKTSSKDPYWYKTHLLPLNHTSQQELSENAPVKHRTESEIQLPTETKASEQGKPATQATKAAVAVAAAYVTTGRPSKLATKLESDKSIAKPCKAKLNIHNSEADKHNALSVSDSECSRQEKSPKDQIRTTTNVLMKPLVPMIRNSKVYVQYGSIKEDKTKQKPGLNIKKNVYIPKDIGKDAGKILSGNLKTHSRSLEQPLKQDEETRDKVKSNSSSASFDSNSTGNIGADAKLKLQNGARTKKISPGVVHIMNPCPSGWIEGGLKEKTTHIKNLPFHENSKETSAAEKPLFADQIKVGLKSQISGLDFDTNTGTAKTNVGESEGDPCSKHDFLIHNKEDEVLSLPPAMSDTPAVFKAKDTCTSENILFTAPKVELLCKRVWTHTKRPKTIEEKTDDKNDKEFTDAICRGPDEAGFKYSYSGPSSNRKQDTTTQSGNHANKPTDVNESTDRDTPAEGEMEHIDVSTEIHDDTKSPKIIEEKTDEKSDKDFTDAICRGPDEAGFKYSYSGHSSNRKQDTTTQSGNHENKPTDANESTDRDTLAEGEMEHKDVSTEIHGDTKSPKIIEEKSDDKNDKDFTNAICSGPDEAKFKYSYFGPSSSRKQDTTILSGNNENKPTDANESADRSTPAEGEMKHNDNGSEIHDGKPDYRDQSGIVNRMTDPYMTDPYVSGHLNSETVQVAPSHPIEHKKAPDLSPVNVTDTNRNSSVNLEASTIDNIVTSRSTRGTGMGLNESFLECKRYTDEEDEESSDSSGTHTDSDSSQEIELASFEMPQQKAQIISDEDMRQNALIADEDSEKRPDPWGFTYGRMSIYQESENPGNEVTAFAIDCSFEDVNTYKIVKKKDETADDAKHPILCECNFNTNVGARYQISGNPYDTDIDHVFGCQYSVNFQDQHFHKVPEIIDDTPYKPIRSNLKCKYKSEPCLFDKRVHFQENLPVYKSSENIRSLPCSGITPEDSEANKLEYMQKFIQCLFENEPRNMGLPRKDIFREPSPSFDDDYGIESVAAQPHSVNSGGTLITNEHDIRHVPVVDQTETSGDKMVGLVNDVPDFTFISDHISDKTVQGKNARSAHTSDLEQSVAPISDLIQGNFDQGIPEQKASADTNDLEVPPRPKLPVKYHPRIVKPVTGKAQKQMPTERFSTDICKDVNKEVCDNPRSSQAVGLKSQEGHSQEGQKSLNQISTILSRMSDGNEQLNNNTKHSSTCEAELIPEATKAKFTTAQENGGSVKLNVKRMNLSSETDLVSVQDKNTKEIEECKSESKKNSSLGRTSSASSAPTDGKIMRYTYTYNDDSDPESPKIKSVTYEYVTEYKLNNVKVNYRQNRKVQTDQDTKTKGKTKSVEKVIAPRSKTKMTDAKVQVSIEEHESTAIPVEEVIEKSVCYPLGPINNVPVTNSPEPPENTEEATFKNMSHTIHAKHDYKGSEGMETSNKEDLKGRSTAPHSSWVKPKIVIHSANSETNMDEKCFHSKHPKHLKKHYPQSLGRGYINKKVIEHNSEKYVWQSFEVDPVAPKLKKGTYALPSSSEKESKRHWTLLDEVDSDCEFEEYRPKKTLDKSATADSVSDPAGCSKNIVEKSGKNLYSALMVEQLPEVHVAESTNETIFIVQAMAVLALGTVLVFLLPYAG